MVFMEAETESHGDKIGQQNVETMANKIQQVSGDLLMISPCFSLKSPFCHVLFVTSQPEDLKYPFSCLSDYHRCCW